MKEPRLTKQNVQRMDKPPQMTMLKMENVEGCCGNTIFSCLVETVLEAVLPPIGDTDSSLIVICNNARFCDATIKVTGEVHASLHLSASSYRISLRDSRCRPHFCSVERLFPSLVCSAFLFALFSFLSTVPDTGLSVSTCWSLAERTRLPPFPLFILS